MRVLDMLMSHLAFLRRRRPAPLPPRAVHPVEASFTGEILHRRPPLGKAREPAGGVGARRLGHPRQSRVPGVVPSGGASLAMVAAFGCYAGGMAFSRARMLGWPLATAHRALTAVTLPILNRSQGETRIKGG